MAGDGSLTGVVIMVATVLLQSQASTPGLHGLIDVEPPMVESRPELLGVADRSLRGRHAGRARYPIQQRGSNSLTLLNLGPSRLVRRGSSAPVKPGAVWQLRSCASGALDELVP